VWPCPESSHSQSGSTKPCGDAGGVHSIIRADLRGHTTLIRNSSGRRPLNTALVFAPMRIDYSDGSYVAFGKPEPGTAGTGDVVVLVDVSCQGFSGRAEGYFERAAFQAFTGALATLLDSGADKASLACESAMNTLEITRVDALGHFVLQVRLSSGVRLGDDQYNATCSAAFPLEWSQLASLRAHLSIQTSGKG
jgi:hypothetical protein